MMHVLVYLCLMSLVCAGSLVHCSNQTSNTDICHTGDIRLANKTSYLEGRVEVCANNQWGTVCDDHFLENNETNVEVVCKQLGFSGEGAMAFAGAAYGKGRGPIVLDNLNCNGSESRLVDCLPVHDCKHDEDIGVRCSKPLGVHIVSKDEIYGNNSLVTAEAIGLLNSSAAGLSCITDEVPCCSQDNTSMAGNWFGPAGNVLPSELNENSIYARRLTNQTIELKYGGGVPVYGIYRCQLPDQYNAVHDLYIGIYSNHSGGEVTVSNMTYNKYEHTIVCTTSGGPATSVVWYKDNSQLDLNNIPFYKFSQIVVDTHTATYENRLTILNKSFMASGEYTCRVVNAKGSASHVLNVSVCRDGEPKFVKKGDRMDPVLSICIDDDWLPINQPFILYEMQTGSDYDIELQADLQSVTFLLSLHSKIAKYQLECTPSIATLKNTVSSTIMESERNRSNVSLLLSGLTHDMDYQCCVTLFLGVEVVQGLQQIHKDCRYITTLGLNDTWPELPSQSQPNSNVIETGLIIGLGSAMVLFLLVLVLVIATWIISCLKRSKTTWTPNTVHITHPNRLSAYEERHVTNPIYSLPLEPQDKRVCATNPVYGPSQDTKPDPMYAHVDDFVNKNMVKSSSSQYITMSSAVVDTAALHAETENTYIHLN